MFLIELFDELHGLGEGEPFNLRRQEDLDEIPPVFELSGDGIQDDILEVLEQGHAAKDDVVGAVKGDERHVTANLAHGQKIEETLRSPPAADQRSGDALGSGNMHNTVYFPRKKFIPTAAKLIPISYAPLQVFLTLQATNRG